MRNTTAAFVLVGTFLLFAAPAETVIAQIHTGLRLTDVRAIMRHRAEGQLDSHSSRGCVTEASLTYFCRTNFEIEALHA